MGNNDPVAGETAAPSAYTELMKQQVRRAFEEIFVLGNVAAVDELFAPDAVFTSTARPEGPLYGRVRADDRRLRDAHGAYKPGGNVSGGVVVFRHVRDVATTWHDSEAADAEADPLVDAPTSAPAGRRKCPVSAAHTAGAP